MGVKAGGTVVVSAASGAVGGLVGQIARIEGAARVVGIAGGDAKCGYCVDELGYDGCIDYRRYGNDTRGAGARPWRMPARTASTAISTMSAAGFPTPSIRSPTRSPGSPSAA